eukprot:SAG11_NODE_12550_length_697_cov_1.377926_2_plen_36_part_01
MFAQASLFNGKLIAIPLGLLTDWRAAAPPADGAAPE